MMVLNPPTIAGVILSIKSAPNSLNLERVIVITSFKLVAFCANKSQFLSFAAFSNADNNVVISVLSPDQPYSNNSSLPTPVSRDNLWNSPCKISFIANAASSSFLPARTYSDETIVMIGNAFFICLAVNSNSKPIADAVSPTIYLLTFL